MPRRRNSSQEKEQEKEARRSLRLRGERTELMKRADYPR